MAKENIASPTKEQINEWKAKYGDVFLIEVEDKKGYLRRPNRNELSYAMTISEAGKNMLKMNEALLQNCWLGGDEIILKEDKYFLAVSGQLAEIIEIAEAKIKKL
ncbi:MAG: hypothetical protein MI922_24615 [Bacteroidales bacterium]|nr:hypothetical protein [Bacteroidales bacterium]